MILTAHQPGYFPYLGTFAKIAQADMFCVFDGVQFERHGYSNRVQIKTHQGPQWLTVPTEHGQPLIKDARIVQNVWKRKHLRTIELAYQKAPYYDRYINELREIIASVQRRCLSELCDVTLFWVLATLGISLPIVHASDYEFRGEKSALVLDMCHQLGATEYIFGRNGRDYADIPAFERAGIKVRFQDYRFESYPQLHGSFVPGLSVIDLLMNCGPYSKKIIENGHHESS